MKGMGRAAGVAVILASLAAACGHAGQGDPGPGGIPHPSGHGRLVLRVATEGGFVSPQALAARIPEFSLFGDGTVVTVGAQPQIYPGPALPGLLERHLTEAGVQAVLRAAARAGLLGPDRTFRRAGISDMPTTVFTLSAEGRTHVVSVYDLGGASPGVPAAERLARRRLADLEARLRDLSSWLRAGSYSKEGPFVPGSMSLFVRPYVADPNLSEPPERWPLSTRLATFGRPSNDLPGARCGTVRGHAAAAVLDLARRTNQLTPWRSDGSSFSLMFRPLLPDQAGC